MKKIALANGEISTAEIALGCMRISGLSDNDASALVDAALACGIDFFDHADIYGGGKSEEVFARVLCNRPGLREKIFIQTKCGIRSGYFDFSKEHIIASAEKSLTRLKTDYLDILLLHRPDTLMEPAEVAEAFSLLHRSGKIRYFGVSNMHPLQMEFLGRALNHKLIVNQLQFSVTNTGMIDAGLNVNMKKPESIDRDGAVLEYCRLNNITIQAWSPLQYGFFEGVFLGSPKFPELNKKLDEIAKLKGVTSTAIAIAWILRHPARIQPVVGTTNAKRLTEICAASQVQLSRQEWYELYRAAGNTLP